jgi:drug/metabolite transporter (DMT)-like permease
LASAVLFGASAPFAKLLLASVDPQLLAGLLYLGAGGGLALVQIARSALGFEPSEAPLRGSDLLWLVAVLGFGGVAGPLLLVLGLARTSAASGSLLLNLEGLATMVSPGSSSGRTSTAAFSSGRQRSSLARSFCLGQARGFASTRAA